MAKTVFTDQQIISQLNSGYKQSGQALTYGFPTTATWFSYAEKTGFTPLSQAQQAAATLAIQLWDDLITPDFTLNTADPTKANVKYMNTTTNVGYAHAYYPTGTQAGGTVWFNSTYGSNSGTNNLINPVVGQWGFQAYVHETGHALGLDHPGAYNGGSPTYATDAEYAQDSLQYTIMSYFTANNTGADWVASDGKSYYAQTPMIDDIMVIQAMYGAETTTRTGNTTYGFNSNADRSVFDFSTNKHPVLGQRRHRYA
jgi:serralysin